MTISQTMSVDGGDTSTMDDNIDPSSTQDMMSPSNSVAQPTRGMSSMSMSMSVGDGGGTSSSQSNINPSTTITSTSSYTSRF